MFQWILRPWEPELPRPQTFMLSNYLPKYPAHGDGERPTAKSKSWHHSYVSGILLFLLWGEREEGRAREGA